jgi:hypothetical protein
LYRVHLTGAGFELTTSVVICIDFTGISGRPVAHGNQNVTWAT